MKNKILFLCLVFCYLSFVYITTTQCSSAPATSSPDLDSFNITRDTLLVTDLQLPFSMKEIESTAKNDVPRSELMKQANEEARHNYLSGLIKKTVTLALNSYNNPCDASNDSSQQQELKNYIYSVVTKLGSNNITKFNSEAFTIVSLTQEELKNENSLLDDFLRRTRTRLRMLDSRTDIECPKTKKFEHALSQVELFIITEKKNAEFEAAEEQKFIFSCVVPYAMPAIGTLLGAGLAGISTTKQKTKIKKLNNKINNKKMDIKSRLASAQTKLNKYIMKNNPTTADLQAFAKSLEEYL